MLSAATLPSGMPPVGMGTPADLLQRRPDVVQACRSVDAAAAALGIARKDYLPSLSVTASVGTQAHSVSDLFLTGVLPTALLRLCRGLFSTGCRDAIMRRRPAGHGERHRRL